MKQIWENETCRFSDIIKSLSTKGPNIPILKGLNREVIFTGCGKAAIKIVLDYLKERGDLPDKNAEVLTPKWLGTCVLNTMHKTCFPTLTPSKNLKGVLVYHQYGFPQDMDKIEEYCERHNLFILEDCANVYESYYKGRRLGTYGIASIFSFSKMFPSILGGVLATNDKSLIKFARAQLEKHDNIMSILSYFGAFMMYKTRGGNLMEPFRQLQEMNYARIDAATKIRDVSLYVVKKELAAGAMEKRKRNYLFLRDYFENYDFFNHLEREGVIPYVALLLTRESKLNKMNKELLKIGVHTGIYHFDVNRNLLNANFKKNLWIPVHQGLDIEDLEMICKTIKKAI